MSKWATDVWILSTGWLGCDVFGGGVGSACGSGSGWWVEWDEVALDDCDGCGGGRVKGLGVGSGGEE